MFENMSEENKTNVKISLVASVFVIIAFAALAFFLVGNPINEANQKIINCLETNEENVNAFNNMSQNYVKFILYLEQLSDETAYKCLDLENKEYGRKRFLIYNSTQSQTVSEVLENSKCSKLNEIYMADTMLWCFNQNKTQIDYTCTLNDKIKVTFEAEPFSLLYVFWEQEMNNGGETNDENQLGELRNY